MLVSGRMAEVKRVMEIKHQYLEERLHSQRAQCTVPPKKKKKDWESEGLGRWGSNPGFSMCQLKWHIKLDIWQGVDAGGSITPSKFCLSICLHNKLSAGRRV